MNSDDGMQQSTDEILKHAFEKIIRSIWSDVQLSVQSAAGGLLVELVGASLEKSLRRKDQLKLTEAIHRYNLEQTIPDHRIFIHRLLMYASYSEIFNTQATLRTRQSGINDYGMLSVTSSGGDVYGFIAELDAEALLYGVERPFKCRLLPAPGTLPVMLRAQTFKEIEFSGQLLTVTSLSPAGAGRGKAANEWLVGVA